ncbi:hypothetical protein CEXT_151771 [Caerostris extrusa]|uniref:Uncharacterized protein n=1 Tax=Caerostris extrusa TaxID=172846 RepID=A0AAV4UUH1_CAEEX|nr:hypothetical protein CEXT_151771 [Caerostris extrusa]
MVAILDKLLVLVDEKNGILKLRPVLCIKSFIHSFRQVLAHPQQSVLPVLREGFRLRSWAGLPGFRELPALQDLPAGRRDHREEGIQR